MKPKLILAFVVLVLAACGELTATPIPTAAPDLTATQMAVKEQAYAAPSVGPAATTSTS